MIDIAGETARVLKAQVNMDRFNDFVNGPAGGSVGTDAGSFPNLATLVQRASLSNESSDADATEAAQSAAAASVSAAAAQAASPRYETTTAGLAATPEGGYFTVAGTGDVFATLYRKTNGAAVLQSSFPSLDGLRNSIGTPEYIARMRPILRRAYNSRKVMPSGRYRQIAHDVILGSSATTASGIRAYRPDGSGAYNSVWIRDLAMASFDAPEFFPAAELVALFNWYKARVNTSGYLVPDRVGLDGTAYMLPGSAPNTLGSRAPTDGNPMLVQLLWNAFAKNGNTAPYTANAAFLRALLDNLPYNATTKCVYVTPGNEWVSWGFMDSVKVNGSVCFGTVLAFRAWQQLADMAFAAKDMVNAAYAIQRAEELRAGLDNLWAGADQDATARLGPNGLYRVSNGSLSYNQLDVWGSLEAAYSGMLSPERERAVATTLVANWGKDAEGKAIWFDRGGVRHILRNNEYAPKSTCWQAFFLGSIGYELYQDGAYWTTMFARAVYVLGLLRPDLAAAAIKDAAREANYQYLRDQKVAAAATYATTAAGAAATQPGQFFKVTGAPLPYQNTGGGNSQQVIAVALPGEWASRQPVGGEGGFSLIGNGLYMTSAAALIAADAVCATGDMSLVVETTINTAQVYAAGAWTAIPDSVVINDTLGCGGDVSTFATGSVEVEAIARLAPQTGGDVPSEVLMAIFINNNMERVIAHDVISTSSAFSLQGRKKIYGVAPNAKIDVRIYPTSKALVSLLDDPARYTNVQVTWSE